MSITALPFTAIQSCREMASRAVEQYSIKVISEEEPVCQLVEKVRLFAYAGPETIQDSLGALLADKAVEAQCTACEPALPSVILISVLYLFVQFHSGIVPEKQARERAAQLVLLLQSLVDSHLAVAREGLACLLAFPVEGVQQMSADSLSGLLNIKTLLDDIEHARIGEIIQLEQQVGKSVALCFRSSKSRSLLTSLLNLYAELLERLWIIPCLAEDSSSLDLSPVQGCLVPLEPNLVENVKLKLAYTSIEKLLLLLNNGPPAELKKRVKELKRYLNLPPFYAFLGDLYQDMGNHERALLLYQRSMEHISSRILPGKRNNAFNV